MKILTRLGSVAFRAEKREIRIKEPLISGHGQAGYSFQAYPVGC